MQHGPNPPDLGTPQSIRAKVFIEPLDESISPFRAAYSDTGSDVNTEPEIQLVLEQVQERTFE